MQQDDDTKRPTHLVTDANAAFFAAKLTDVSWSFDYNNRVYDLAN